MLIPAGVIHTFGNESDRTATFLNVHAPSCGFGANLRDEDADFDSEDPPAGGGRDPGDAIVRGPGEGASLPMGILFKAEDGDGDGTLSLGELTLPQGFPGPLPHRHARMIDSFYVLEGTLTLRLGGKTREAPAGSFAFAPPGVAHTFSNPRDAPVRALDLMAPGGLEQYLKEVAATAGGGPPDPQTMAAIASRYDFLPVD